jgi:hypothetical protein
MVEEPRIAIRGADTAILGTQQMPLSKHQFASFNLKSIGKNSSLPTTMEKAFHFHLVSDGLPLIQSCFPFCGIDLSYTSLP